MTAIAKFALVAVAAIALLASLALYRDPAMALFLENFSFCS